MEHCAYAIVWRQLHKWTLLPLGRPQSNHVAKQHALGEAGGAQNQEKVPGKNGQHFVYIGTY